MNCWVTEAGSLEVLPKKPVHISEVQRVINEFLWTQDKLALKFCPYDMRTRQAVRHREWLGRGVLFVELTKVLELASLAIPVAEITIEYRKWENDRAGKELPIGEHASDWDIYEALCMLVGAGFGYWDTGS